MRSSLRTRLKRRIMRAKRSQKAHYACQLSLNGCHFATRDTLNLAPHPLGRKIQGCTLFGALAAEGQLKPRKSSNADKKLVH